MIPSSVAIVGGALGLIALICMLIPRIHHHYLQRKGERILRKMEYEHMLIEMEAAKIAYCMAIREALSEEINPEI